MKIIKRLIIPVIFLFSCISILFAQNTEGRDFWLTFGSVAGYPSDILDMQIRIVGGNLKTEVNIYFTNLGTSVQFDIDPYEVFTHNLDTEQRAAACNIVMGTTNYSIHITASNPVTVYAFNHCYQFCEATNILPVTALGTEYYQISYHVVSFNSYNDYAVLATEDNTDLYHNGDFVTTLRAGDVYYRTSLTDMTGAHITSNNPVAFFALHKNTAVPHTGGYTNHLFQQLATVHTWGKTFFVPVTIFEKDIVRIVASQNGTTITQTGGSIRTGVPGAQTSLTGLQAGQFVELDINLTNNGCYIQADKPVGVCSYLANIQYTGFPSSPAQAWIPGIEQTIVKVLTAPFAPNGPTSLVTHYALVFTPTATKNNTLVSIAGSVPIPLNSNAWHDNVAAGKSFCSIELTDITASYIFSNSEGIIVLGYGHGIGGGVFDLASYYYLAGSAMRTLNLVFYANDIHCWDLENNQICEKEVSFRAEIENIGVEVDSIKWYIDGVEFEPAQNQETWDYTFTQVGEYIITMEVYYFENGETKTKTITGTLKRKDLWIKMRNIKH